MHISYHKEWSHSLNRDMEYKVYGHRGKPILVFPTSGGRFFQYEDNGMIEELSDYIEEGRIQLWACDGIDEETFFAHHPDIHTRMTRHKQYDQYIAQELVPSILQTSKMNNNGDEQKIWITGCSMGAFHSANFFFRHPFAFDGLLALSGVYSTTYFFGNHMDDDVYFHSILSYLNDLHDESYLQSYRQSRLVICTGQGAYEKEMIEETHQLKILLKKKSIPARIDFWGHDSHHDWDWWRKQFRFYISEWM
jgi:esterase/lipase superfamily enzyme